MSGGLRSRSACLLAAGFLGTASTGCGGDTAHEGDGEANRPSTTGGEARPKPLRHVEKVLNRERERLLGRYDAEGVGIGSEDPLVPRDPQDPVYLIVVDVEDEDARPEGEHAVDGVPIRFVVSGKVRPE